MKKCIRVLGITVFAVLFGFTMTACGGGGGGENLPPAGSGRISFEVPHIFRVYYYNDGSRFTAGRVFIYTYYWDEEGDIRYLLALSNILRESGTVSAAGGYLTLQLGSPTESAPWMDVSALAPAGFTVTSGLRIFQIWGFICQNEQYSLRRRSDDGEVGLVYANRSGHIRGEFFDAEEGEWFRTNWNLRQGWNTIIETWSEGISVTGTPGDNFRWVIEQ